MKVIALFLLFSGQALALTESEVVNSVLTHFPLVDQAVMKLEAAEGEVTAAKGAFDHKLNFKSRLWRQRPYNNEFMETYLERQTPYGGAKVAVGHRVGAGEFNYYDLKKDTSSAGQLFAGLTMPLLRDFSTDEFRTNLEVKKLRQQQAEQEVVLKKLVYVHKALSLYYKWIFEVKKIEVSEYLLSLAKDRQVMIEKKYKAGDMERLKMTDNQRQINKRESELEKNKIDLNKIAAELSLYVRNQEGRPVYPERIKDPEIVLKKAGIEERSKQGRENPQLEVLSFEHQMMVQNNKLYKQSRLPGLDVELMGAKELSERPGYGEHIFQFGLKFDFPLENRKGRGQTVASMYKFKAIEKELIYLKQELKQMFEFSKDASSKSYKIWDVTNKEYENTQQVAVGERSKWQNGSSDLFVVNMREQDVADVDIRRWKALYDYHQYSLDAALFSATLPVEKE